MIKHSQNIVINCEIQKAWRFLIDLSKSLIFDRYFILIEIPHDYTLNNDSQFLIKAKYLLTKYNFTGSIIKNTPPNMIKIKLVDTLKKSLNYWAMLERAFYVYKI